MPNPPIKKIPHSVIEADARWLDESHAIHFTIDELNKRGLKFSGSIHDLLKENRRSPCYISRFDKATGKAFDMPTRGNRSSYGLCKYFKSTLHNRVHYWRPDLLNWLENHIFPRCITATRPKRRAA